MHEIIDGKVIELTDAQAATHLARGLQTNINGVLQVVEMLVEQARSRYSTPSMERMYDKQAGEGRAWLAQVAANEVPDLAAYPMIESEVDRKAGKPGAMDGAAVAELWVRKSKEEAAVMALINRARSDAKEAVKAADTPAALEDAYRRFLEALAKLPQSY